MSKFNKENWCRGPSCKYHPDPFTIMGLEFKKFKFKLTRCLECKRFVQKDLYSETT